MGLNTFDQRAKTWDGDPHKVERARVVLMTAQKGSSQKDTP